MFISKKFFFVSPRFCKVWCQAFDRWGFYQFWLRRCLGAVFETPLSHRASFCELRLRPRVFFENYLSFFKAEQVLLAWQLWWSPCLAKHFGDGTYTSKIRRKTSRLGVGEIKSLASTHGPKEKNKNTKKSVCDCAMSQPFIIHKTSGFWRTCFQDPVLLQFCTSLFSCTWMYSCRFFQAEARGKRRKAVIRDISGAGHRGVTNLSALIWFPGERHCTVFRHLTQLWFSPLHPYTHRTQRFGLGALVWQQNSKTKDEDRMRATWRKRESERRREDRVTKRGQTRKTIRCYQSEQ